MVFLFRRFIAFYIDALFVTILLVFVHLIYFRMNGITNLEDMEQSSDILLILQFVGYFIYCFICETIFKTTIGKRLLKLVIIGINDDKKRRLFQILKRTIFRLIPFEPLSIFLNEEREMWHDKISKTKVVDVRKK